MTMINFINLFRIYDFKFRIYDFKFRIYDFKFRIYDFKFRVSNSVPLVAEGRASDELAQEGSRRYFALGHRYEVLQELQ